MIVGTRLMYQKYFRDREGGICYINSRGNTSLDYLFGDVPKALAIGLLVALKDREIKAICTVDLDVHKARTSRQSYRCRSTDYASECVHNALPENVPTQVYDFSRSLLSQEERALERGSIVS